MSITMTSKPGENAGVSVPATRLQALLSLCVGLAIVGIVGFSHIEVIHNAAHDTRHASGFPCH